jgi:hypothetical protein
MATAKPTFAKMGLKMNTSVKTISIGEQEIEIKQYLPINDKLELIGRVISAAADDNNFSNPIKLDVFTNLEIVFAYTNIQFTDKQKEDLVKLYDILESNDVFTIIIQNIPKAEYESILNGIEECSEAIYTYKSSVLGILETVAQDYKDVNYDANQISEALNNPEGLTLLKEVLSKMG